MQISVCTGKALLVEALAALGDDRLGFAVAVHLMAREAVMAGEQVVVEDDADEGDGTSCDVDEGEAEGRDKAAERVWADADAEVKQDEVSARRDADLMHRCAVDGKSMAGSRRRAVAEAEEECADQHGCVRAGRTDEAHGDGHADECRVDDDVAAEVVEQVASQRAADEGSSGEAEEEARRADARDADVSRVGAEEAQDRGVADTGHQGDAGDGECLDGEEAVERDLVEICFLFWQDRALRRLDEEGEREDQEGCGRADLDGEREFLGGREVHGDEGADGRSHRDAEREVADARAHALERDECGDDRARCRRGRAERQAMQEADEHEDLERRRELVAEDEQEEHQRAGKEHLAAADEIDEASSWDAGEQGTDDEEARGEAGHADGSIPGVDGIGRRPEHQEEVDRVDEEVDTDVKYVVTRPEARRGS